MASRIVEQRQKASSSSSQQGIDQHEAGALDIVDESIRPSQGPATPEKNMIRIRPRRKISIEYPARKMLRQHGRTGILFKAAITPANRQAQVTPANNRAAARPSSRSPGRDDRSTTRIACAAIRQDLAA